MEEKSNMTAERSLEIIREQIERSQRTTARNASYSLLWWGTCVVVFSFLVAYLWNNYGGPAWNALWAVMFVVGNIGEWAIKKYKDPIPVTFVGKTIGQVWSTFGIFMCLFGIILGLAGSGILRVDMILPDKYNHLNITSIISLCFGIASTIMGFILKNRVVQVCGIIAGLGGFFCALQYPWAEQLYVMAAVALVGMIIPAVFIYFQDKE